MQETRQTLGVYLYALGGLLSPFSAGSDSEILLSSKGGSCLPRGSWRTVCGMLLNRYWVARGQCVQTVAGTLLWMWWRAEPPRISVLWLA